MSRARPRTAVILPVLNEELALPLVLGELPHEVLDTVIVVDNGSTDRSAEIARAHGARVVVERQRGYGAACLAGIAAATDHELLAFVDGDHSDYPEDLRVLHALVARGDADLAIGSRMRDPIARRALLPQQRVGNWIASRLLRWLFGIRCTDLGPMRVVRAASLEALAMRDRSYGWTIEMQIKAHRAGLRVVEVPVRYRARVGHSKISGTWRGSLAAGVKILKTIVAYRLRPAGGTPSG